MVNNVVLIGRITRDLELRSTANGREVLNFSLAVNRNFKNQNGEYDADFINCVAYGQTAKFLSSYSGKGQLISVTGRIQTRNYENNTGQRVYVTEVIVDSANTLERRDSNNQGFNNQNNNFNQQQNQNSTPSMSPQDFMQNEAINQPSYAVDDIDDDDLPF